MPFDPSTAEMSRALYEESPMPVRDLAALHGVSERSVYRYAARHGWRRRRTRLAIWQQSFRQHTPAELSEMKRREKPAAPSTNTATRRELVIRLWAAAEKHVAAVEQRLAQSLDDPVAAQPDIQLLSLLSRSMQQLALLDRAYAPETDDDHDAVPRDLDELRRRLSERLGKLIAGSTSDGDRGAAD